MIVRRPGLRWLVVAALLAVTAACGLSEDGEPQAISPDNLPPDLLDPSPPTNTSLPPSPDTTPVTIYFLEPSGEANVLTPVERGVADPARPGERIGALLTQVPTEEEQSEGIFSSIPAGLTLLDTELDQESEVLVINLSQELFDIQGRELSNAFAQLVYTAAEVNGVREVRFQVDGEDIQARDGSGSERSAVSITDYRSLAPQ